MWTKQENEDDDGDSWHSTPPSPRETPGEQARYIGNGIRKFWTSSRASTFKIHAVFWALGLFNHFGNALMLSSAHDIVFSQDHKTTGRPSTNLPHPNETCSALRCNSQSTATILLASVLPGLIIKLCLPHVLKAIPGGIRVAANVVLAIGSLLLVGLTHIRVLSYLGVAMMSSSVAIGDVTFLSLISQFPASTVAFWSSGTGAAGATAAWIYLFLRIHLPQRDTMLYCLLAPLLTALTCLTALRTEMTQSKCCGTTSEPAAVKLQTVYASSNGKGRTLPLAILSEWRSLLKYMVPLFLVYFVEYLINQGLYELMAWRNCISLDPHEQYRWFQALYQLGVFLSRSFACRLPYKAIWLLPVLQVINLGALLGEVSDHIFPTIYISFALTLYEGLLGGSCYINSLRLLHQEMDGARREFSLAFVTVADSIGIALAGVVALPIHSGFCRSRSHF